MKNSRHRPLEDLLHQRILILDGAMGTTIREYQLTEEQARGERFAQNDEDLLNNGDILNLTQPDVIADIHRRFFEAGADLCETNTFSATTLAQSEFFVPDPRSRGQRKDPEFFQREVLENTSLLQMVEDLNIRSVELVRREAEKAEKADGRPRFVAGAIGPLTVSLTALSDPDDPEFRAITFDQVKAAYRHQIEALCRSGCDLLMIETIFDSLNAKAATVAALEHFEAAGESWPLIHSAAVGRGGETMISAQKIDALWVALESSYPLAIGLNCSLGPDLMRPHLETLSQVATTAVSCYPNAGLPNPLAPTGFDLEPADMGRHLREFGEAGLLNLAGGCCGNTPAHIAAIARALDGLPPRPIPTKEPLTSPATS